jgi:hypothetical protein
MFLAFTFVGTMIDYDSRKIRSYTSLFGLVKIGKWHSIENFTKYRIYRSSRVSTTYSRANVPLTVKNTDIRSVFLNNSGSLKITLNKYDSFEKARNEVSELIRGLQITQMEEVRK